VISRLVIPGGTVNVWRPPVYENVNDGACEFVADDTSAA
jgi:hypothetical protein